MSLFFDEINLYQQAKSNSDLKVNIVSHPLVYSALSTMRSDKTSMADFRYAVHALTPLLVYAATADLSLTKVKLNTPLAPINGRKIQDNIVLIPVLRSGIGMHQPAQVIFPDARTIFAGLSRDESTAIAHWYYDLKELKDLNSGEGTVFIILDPMLATGGSAIETIKRIKQIYPHAKIKMIAMISAPDGIMKLNKEYPDVQITTASVDDHLNDKKYIVPGLGDAGDRQFGTN